MVEMSSLHEESNAQLARTPIVRVIDDDDKVRRSWQFVLEGEGWQVQAYESAVRFLGPRQDVPALLSAMDCFIFPSHHEGLPVTLVEAQAAGLPVAASSAITDEVCITPLVRRLGLDVPAGDWAAAALELAAGGFEARRCPADALRGAGYDIADTARWLEDFYLARAAQDEE